MTSDRFQRIKEIFHAAIELQPGERAAHLASACRDDPDLRSEVEALLRAHPGSDGFLESMLPAEAVPDPFDASLAGARIGRYVLKGIISAGGMGTVFEAEQEDPQRTVALKIMRAGMASRASLRRFRHEAQILASLQHPGIAQVFETGVHKVDGNGRGEVPYFVMEYVPGALSLTEYARKRNLGINERLRLFVQVLEAVHHGHQKGIIHRDLKPGNILVDGDGHVKIIDFGVARATDADVRLTTQHTDVGQLLGTVQYMSPEQCRADPVDLDIRSDVYALGIVLYELLCERLPYDVRDAAVFEATRRIMEEPPERPSSTRHGLRGDVETILLKALEKERDRRYPSADAFRSDIERFLKGEPITARPPSVLYQLKFFARRNRALVAGASAAFLALLAGFIVSTSLYLQADGARREATRNQERAEKVNAFFNGMLIDSDPVGIYRISGFGLGRGRTAKAALGQEPGVSVVTMMRSAVPRIEDEFAGDPLLEATVRNTFGTAFSSLTLHKEGEEQVRQAFEIRRELLGDDHPDTLSSQVRLGYILYWLGRDGEAEPLFRAALERLEGMFGEEDPETLSCGRGLAMVLFNLGSVDESDALFERTLMLQRKVLSPGDRETLSTNSFWCLSLMYQRRYRQMNALAREALDLAVRFYGPDDFMALWPGMYLAIHLFGRDRRAAEAMLADLRERCRRNFGERNIATLVADDLYAMCIQDAGRLDEKEDLHRRAFEAFQVQLGCGHIFAQVGINDLVDLLWRRGKLPEAEQALRGWLDSCTRSLGPEHPRTFLALEMLAAFLVETGRMEEGEDCYRQRADAHERIHGEGSGAAIDALAEAAAALQAAGRRDSARRLAVRALETGRSRMEGRDATAADRNAYARLLLTLEPPDLRDPAAALPLAEQAVHSVQEPAAHFLETLALAHHMNGNHGEAVAWQRKAVARLRPGETAYRAARERNLVRFLIAAGDRGGAERFLTACHDRRRREMGDLSSNLAWRFIEDGWMLIDAGCPDLAEPVLAEAYEVAETLPWNYCGPYRYRRIFQGMIRICEDRGREGEAELWRERLLSLPLVVPDDQGD